MFIALVGVCVCARARAVSNWGFDNVKQESGHLRGTRAPLGGARAQSKEAYVPKST